MIISRRWIFLTIQLQRTKDFRFNFFFFLKNCNGNDSQVYSIDHNLLSLEGEQKAYLTYSTQRFFLRANYVHCSECFGSLQGKSNARITTLPKGKHMPFRSTSFELGLFKSLTGLDSKNDCKQRLSMICDTLCAILVAFDLWTPIWSANKFYEILQWFERNPK